MNLKQVKRLVVKIGSSIVINTDNSIRNSWLASLAQDVFTLKKQGIEVVIVSSGAVATGKDIYAHDDLSIEEKQASFAVGQVKLIEAYRKAFEAFDLKIAQVLLNFDDTENRRRYLNCTSTLENLISKDIIPIINENDVVSTSELRYGDNDRLSARVALMVQANTLFLLSDINGLYTGNPKLDKNATLLEKVGTIDQSIFDMASDGTNVFGTGGMKTKIIAAQMSTSSGVSCVITNGLIKNPVMSYLNGSSKGTIFYSSANLQAARKAWILGGLNPRGSVTIDKGAFVALKDEKSLLAIGIISCSGKFERGDLITIKSGNKKIAKGISGFSRQEVEKIKGNNSSKIEQILGYSGRNEVVHKNDLVLEKICI